MKTKLTKTLFLGLFFLWGISLSWGQHMNEIIATKDPLKQLEKVLMSPVDYKQDTLTLQKNLKPILDLANKERSVPLKWAYYMLMADGYSIAFDRVNPRTDHFFSLGEKLVFDNDYPVLQMVGNVRHGSYYFTYRAVKEAFPYFLQAADLQKNTATDKVPLIEMHYNFLARFYSYIGENAKAVEYLKLALPYTEKLSRKQIDMTNSIAVYLRRDSLFDQSHTYFIQAMQTAKLAKDSVWIGIIAGNLADFEWEKGNKNKAMALVQQNIDLSLRYNELLDAMRAKLILASMLIDQKQWLKAKEHVHQSMQLMEDKPYFLSFKRDAAKALSQIAKGMGQPDEELRQLHRFISYEDSLEKRNSNSEMQKISWKWEMERYEQAIKIAENKRQQIKQTYQYVGVFLILIFVIVLLLINRTKNKIQIRSAHLEKEQLALAYEKQLVDQELLVLKDSLQEFTNTIKINDQTINRLRRELLEENKHDLESQTQIAKSLNMMLETHIMTDERWMKFKNVFDKVHPNFLQRQKEIYPKLTENDLRLIALGKLELSNRSMSDLLGVSLEGIKKAKQRLKKKLEEMHSPS
ncbi:hypothetical protein GCM10022216_32280 [Sphingobacterium kyonggiense]|uniref:MalT-like TPR region domain-containing protein n=1 Tax=Sphingobacterium kyonggiense TaxID=714075 RepID=A0ABP7Z3Z1_9SPHI